MKKLLIALMALLIGTGLKGQLESSFSLMSTGLASAKAEKGRSGGTFKDESYKATLAALWDILPEKTKNQKDAKANLAAEYRNVFSVSPEHVDLTNMTQYVSLSEICKQTEEQLKDQLQELQARHDKLAKEHKKVTQESKGHQASLSGLSLALNDYSRSFKNLAKALKSSEDAHTAQAGELSAAVIEERKNNLVAAQDDYVKSLENLHDKAIDFNLDVNLANNYLTAIVKGELAKYGTSEEPITSQPERRAVVPT